MEFKFRNVNDAYSEMIPWLVENGSHADSRNGPVVRSQEPVVWKIKKPWERVLLDPSRDANPFFHLYEGLWMIYGAHDVKPLVHFVKKMVDFTDNGSTVPGAYGHRLQKGVDQWRPALHALNKNPDTRRVVLSMYDPRKDSLALISEGKDIPCNTHMYLTLRDDALCMTVLNRSNDIEWGALGANAVHFSMMHEWASDILGVPQGPMTTFSNDLHKYTRRDIPSPSKIDSNPYDNLHYGPTPMECYTKDWNRDLQRAVREGWHRNLGYKTYWFSSVFRPMMLSHNQFKQGSWDKAWVTIQTVESEDWKKAGEMWLSARQPN